MTTATTTAEGAAGGVRAARTIKGVVTTTDPVATGLVI